MRLFRVTRHDCGGFVLSFGRGFEVTGLLRKVATVIEMLLVYNVVVIKLEAARSHRRERVDGDVECAHGGCGVVE
jgi:hypothetical protein